MKRAVVEADQPRMDISPSGLVTAIVTLCSMVQDVPHRWLDVQTLAPFDSIIMQLVGYQGNRLVPLL